jgi:hypothetical protein
MAESLDAPSTLSPYQCTDDRTGPSRLDALHDPFEPGLRRVGANLDRQDLPDPDPRLPIGRRNQAFDLGASLPHHAVGTDVLGIGRKPCAESLRIARVPGRNQCHHNVMDRGIGCHWGGPGKAFGFSDNPSVLPMI